MINGNQLIHIFSGNSILFLGAGFSRGATNVIGTDLPSGDELKSTLSNELNVSHPYTLEQLAELYIEKRSQEDLWSTLKSRFTVKKIQRYHEQVVSLPWKRIYTTNYDNVVECAAANIGKKVATLGIEHNLNSVPKDHLPVIHIHGSVIAGEAADLQTKLKLSEASFRAEDMQTNKCYIDFRHAVDLNPSIIFLGYSLLDIDFQRLLFGLGDLRRKTLFIIGETPDPLTEARAAKIGTVLKKHTAQVAKTLTKGFETYEPLQRTETQIGNAIQPIECQPARKVTDDEIFKFFLFGRMNDDLFHSDSLGLIRRGEAEELLKSVEKEKCITVLHSALGNGKTVLVTAFAKIAKEAGLKVFELINFNTEFSEELKAINHEKSVLVIEEYVDWIKALRYLRTVQDIRLSLLLTSRTVSHDLFFDRLLEMFDDNDIEEICCDKISSAAVDEFVEVFDRYSLWSGDLTGKRRIIKRTKLEKDCNSQIHAILITALKAPQMRMRLKQIIGKMENNEDMHQILITMCALSFIQMATNLSKLYEILGDQIYSATIKKNPVMSELVEFSSGQVFFRSPIAAEFILKEVFSANDVATVLINIMDRATRMASSSEFAWSVTGKIMRFSFLERMLSTQGRLPAAIRFYEATKMFGKYSKNSHFWLQYAIACTSLGELDRAERYFENAKAIARRRDDNDSEDKINNHYARYLLECAVNGSDDVNFFPMFHSARLIIEDQIRRRKFDIKLKHYPFKMAQHYAEFYDRYAGRMTEDQLKELGRSAKFILARIYELKEDESQQSNVRHCLNSMQYVTRTLEERSVQF